MSEQTNILKKQLEKSPKKTNLIDLGVGNPAFMQEYWNLVHNYYNGSIGASSVKINELMNYDYEQSNDTLKSLIKDLHKEEGNAKTDGYEVVLGNGAAQLVAAAAYAATFSGANTFILAHPHWGRLKTLISMGSNVATGNENAHIYPPGEYELSAKYAELTVWPNNPDSSLVEESEQSSNATVRIHDLCYNWKQYLPTDKMKKREDDVMIFGLAKATGHAGTRIGWALVKDKDFAKHMVKFIELTTSGVSHEGQQRAVVVLNAIKQLQKMQFTSPFVYGKAELSNRWSTFLTVADYHTEEFTVSNTFGMFAWCKHVNPNAAKEMETTYGVKVVDGATLGMTSEYFRVSLGCSKESFDKLIKTLE